jgi:hypothetical protein
LKDDVGIGLPLVPSDPEHLAGTEIRAAIDLDLFAFLSLIMVNRSSPMNGIAVAVFA